MNIKRMVNELITALNWCEDDQLVDDCLDHINSGIEFEDEEVERDD